MNNKGQVTKARLLEVAKSQALVPATNGLNNVKQLAKKKEGTNKAQISNAKAGVTYATIGCQTDRTMDNYGTPRKMIQFPAQAPNCGLTGKGCAENKTLKNKSNQTNKVGKNQSNQTRKLPLQAQPDQLQAKQNAQQAGKKSPPRTDKQRQTRMNPNQASKHQPQQLSPQAYHKAHSLVVSDNGQACIETSVRVNMSLGPQGRGSPVKKYTHEQLMSQMARLDMNNNQPPELAKLQSDGKRILSNISQLELRAELLVNSVPFRMPNST